MSEVLIEALDDCLQAMAAGADLEAALARYPDLADELRPLLTAASAARPIEPLRVPRQSEAASRARFLARARVLAGERRRSAGLFGSLSLTLRLGLAVLAVAAASGLGAAGLVSASAQSLPGDALYGVKRAAEQAQLALAANPAARAALENQFDQRRLAEAEAVAALGREVAVTFTGPVEAQAGERWTIAGLTVLVPAGLGEGVSVGQTVAVAGLVQADGVILAREVAPRGPAGPTASPAPTLTATAPPVTETAEPTESPEPEDTRAPQATLSTSPTKPAVVTATPRPPVAGASASPTKAAPTQTPKAGGGDPEPTQTPKPSETPKSGSDPSPSSTPRPTDTRRPSATPDDDQTPEATHTPEAGGDPTPGSTPNDDSEQTPEASQTPQPDSVDFEGRVEAVGDTWVISGESVIITGATEFRDNPQLGDRVKVSGWRYWDGRLVARRIEKD